MNFGRRRVKKILSLIIIVAAVINAPGQRRAGSGAIDLLITGGAVVTMDADRRILENGFVAIRGDRIVDAGDAATLKAKGYVARQTIDARGHVVLAGLI